MHVGSVPSISRWSDDDLALSGRPLTEITIRSAVQEIFPADLRIHPDTLRRQASVAEQHGNPQLADNLRRAAELAPSGDDEVLAVYEALRPGRSSLAELVHRGSSRGVERTRCAALVEAARGSTSGVDCESPPESGPAGSQP